MTTQHDYKSSTVRDLRELCKLRKITPPRNATKEQLAGVLETADKALAKNAPKDETAQPEMPPAAPPANASDFGDLPETSEAPDAYEPPAPPPSTDVAAAVKIPPDPVEITPENAPPEPRRYKLTNDIDYPQGGMPVRMKAGKILTTDEYDMNVVKAAGGVVVPARVFEKK